MLTSFEQKLQWNTAARDRFTLRNSTKGKPKAKKEGKKQQGNLESLVPMTTTNVNSDNHSNNTFQTQPKCYQINTNSTLKGLEKETCSLLQACQILYIPLYFLCYTTCSAVPKPVLNFPGVRGGTQSLEIKFGHVFQIFKRSLQFMLFLLYCRSFEMVSMVIHILYAVTLKIYSTVLFLKSLFLLVLLFYKG